MAPFVQAPGPRQIEAEQAARFLGLGVQLRLSFEVQGGGGRRWRAQLCSVAFKVGIPCWWPLSCLKSAQYPVLTIVSKG